MREIVLIIFCIILYGSATFFKRLGLLNLHPYQFLIVAGFCYFLFTPLWYWLLSHQTTSQGAALTYHTDGVIFAIIYALFSIAAGLTLAFLLRTTSSPGMLVVMVNLSSLVTLLLSYLFLNEQLNPVKIIAIILAVFSVILMNY
jgi:drug/metabolite transporter (DMT)-like permease